MEDVGVVLKTGHKPLLFLCSGAGDWQPDPFLPDGNPESFPIKHLPVMNSEANLLVKNQASSPAQLPLLPGLRSLSKRTLNTL